MMEKQTSCLEVYEVKKISSQLRWLTPVYGGLQMLSTITGAHCEGANNKCKVKNIIQDNGCMFFYHALAKIGSKQVAECPSEDWALIL